MGIPVSGKNLFPSNIQGLPTWYEIRVNNEGHTARALNYDLMVAMNAQTYARDIKEVRQGGYVLYDSSWPLDKSLYRDDVNFMPIPFAQICNERFKDARARTLMKNIAYAGALVATLEIDMNTVEALLDERFAGKKALRDSNLQALKIGYDYAKEKFACPLPFHLQPMSANGDKILIDGNTATALGCVYAGATVAAWYPSLRLRPSWTRSKSSAKSIGAIRKPAAITIASSKRKTNWRQSAWSSARHGTVRVRLLPRPALASHS